MFFVDIRPPTPFSMLKHSSWTLALDYNIENGVGEGDMRTEDWRIPRLTKKDSFRGVSQLRLTLIVVILVSFSFKKLFKIYLFVIRGPFI